MKKFRGPKVTSINDGRKELVNLLLGERNIGHLIARVSCFDEVGLFNTKFCMSEDWDMWIRLAKKYKVGHIAEPMIKARYHVQSLTAKSDVEIVKNAHTALLESVFQDTELAPLFSHLRGKAYFGLNCLIARVAALTGHKITAIKYFKKAIGIYPRVFIDIMMLSLLIRSTKVLLPQKLRRIIIDLLMTLRLR
jgi:hypothetical protein